jgi:hypothetical protein
MNAMNEQRWSMKWWRDGPFILIVVVIVGLIGFFVAMVNLPFPSPTGYIQIKPEQKPVVESRVVDSKAGPIEIIDLRSGTEINRIILLPNGQAIAEGLYFNSLGEQRVRLISNAEAK